jgi:hypothetical protein
VGETFWRLHAEPKGTSDWESVVTQDLTSAIRHSRLRSSTGLSFFKLHQQAGRHAGPSRAITPH